MAPPQPREEREWSVQSLLEQVELLETILLYYKDFVHRPAELRNHANQLWENGCGLRQSCPAPLVEGGDILQQHIRLTHTLTPSHPPCSHLCSLILLESLDLDSILANMEDPRYDGMGM